MNTFLIVTLVLVAAVAIPLLWLGVQMRWVRRETMHGAYFRRPLAEPLSRTSCGVAGAGWCPR